MSWQIDGPYVFARMLPSRLRQKQGNNHASEHSNPA
jgi:hypothetical protein